MRTNLFAVASVVVLSVAGGAWAGGLFTSSKTSCCPDGACCPDGVCCVEDSCCVPGAACCEPGAACCDGVMVKPDAKTDASCCVPGAPCCEPGAACCVRAAPKACCAGN